MIEGFSFLAIWNNDLIIFSDYPTYFDIISLELTEKNVPFYISVAQALAK
jgi:hypothetical protein